MSELKMLEREEYVEQAHMFRVLGERLLDHRPLQEVLEQVREELLSTTKLSLAIDFMVSELKHSGSFAPAMIRLRHYFTPFQTYVIQEAENERGRFDMRVALEILRAEAAYRTDAVSRQGMFMFMFEALCRNRLRYDKGLEAIANDPLFNDDWREWIFTVRRQIGIVDFADLLYVRSEFYVKRKSTLDGIPYSSEKPILFSEKDGRIAWANRRKDPLYLFAALQRHLGYPTVPRPVRYDETQQLLPQILRQLLRLEGRIKLLEDETREGIDITQFYQNPNMQLPPDE